MKFAGEIKLEGFIYLNVYGCIVMAMNSPTTI